MYWTVDHCLFRNHNWKRNHDFVIMHAFSALDRIVFCAISISSRRVQCIIICSSYSFLCINLLIWYAYCIGKKVKFCHLHVLENKNGISYEYGVVGKAAFQNITPHITLFGVNKIRTFLHYLSYSIRE